MRRALFFVRSAIEFGQYWPYLKSVPCPHCRAVGSLNRHGSLRGYSENGSERVVRGWRIFCSNRGRHHGCGRTHAVLLAAHLHRRIVTAARFWNFLKGVMGGASIPSAWESARGVFTVECRYRLWQAFERFQPILRSLLCRIKAPPPSSAQSAKLQTLEHLRAAFAKESCPIAAWQAHFQRPFAA